MMFVVDTNVVSELRKVRSGKADANGMTVVTRNVADFDDTGVTVLNPWA
jgi:predicted nucleic acid-binding protein